MTREKQIAKLEDQRKQFENEMYVIFEDPSCVLPIPQDMQNKLLSLAEQLRATKRELIKLKAQS